MLAKQNISGVCHSAIPSGSFSIVNSFTEFHVVLSKPYFLKSLLYSSKASLPGGGPIPVAFGYTDVGDAYVGLEGFLLEFNAWSFVILTAVSMSLLAFWAINPHPNFFFSLLIFELIFVSIAVETIGISKLLGIAGGFVFALFLLTFAALESAVGLAYLVFFSKQVQGARAYL